MASFVPDFDKMINNMYFSHPRFQHTQFINVFIQKQKILFKNAKEIMNRRLWISSQIIKKWIIVGPVSQCSKQFLNYL